MLRNTSFLNELVSGVGFDYLFLVYTNLTRSTDIYNKSNKLNWTNKTVFSFSGKVRSMSTLTLRVRSCLSWHLDARHPLVRFPNWLVSQLPGVVVGEPDWSPRTRTQCTEQSWCDIRWWKIFKLCKNLNPILCICFISQEMFSSNLSSSETVLDLLDEG